VELDDIDLLRMYQQDGRESAFSKLVERHGGWIFAAARRRLGSDHLADDAAQAVFVVLASKARELLASRQGSISAWLFHVVHFTCARLRRSRSRERLLDQAAHEKTPEEPDRLTVDEPLLLLMEECIAQLGAAEREMIVRRFYQRQSFAQIGAAMDVSSEAARKRVSRSLAQVRQLMVRDGIDSIPDQLLVEVQGPRRRAKLATERINRKVKETLAMSQQSEPAPGGHQMISAEFLVSEVEANLDFFEKLGFPRRFIDKPDSAGRIPRASLTAGHMGKIWIRRAEPAEIHPSPSINVFFWINGGPDALIAFRTQLSERGVEVTAIIDEHGLPNFNVTTPDGYTIAFFTQYVAPGTPPIVLVR
jgi:RNA polymerase sigma factor (sigma-70 family)